MSNNTTIFNKLNSPYTEAEYTTSSQRVKSHLFHFFLGLNQPAQFVVTQIKSAVEKANATQMAKLTQADAQNYMWTPLHIAVMQGKLEVVVALLAVKSVRETLSARDEQGWTAFHHAAVPSQNSKAIEAELNKAYAVAKQEMKRLNKTLDEPGLTYSILPCDEDGRLTAPGLSVQDIKNYTDLSLGSSEIKNVQFKGTPLTADKIKDLGMTHFRDDLYFPNPRDLWAAKQVDDEVASVNRVKSNSLNKMQNRRVNIVPVPEGGYGLESTQLLEPGTVLGVYAGPIDNAPSMHRPFVANFSPQIIQKEQYLFRKCNPITIGNHLRFMQSGFGNVSAYSVVHNGAEKTMFVAIREIKPGDQIVYDYGASYYHLSYGPQRIYGLEELCKIYARDGFDKVVSCPTATPNVTVTPTKSIDKVTIREDTPQLLENTRSAALVQFPLNNPLALLNLHYTGIVPVSYWQQAFLTGKYEIITGWAQKFPIPHFYLDLLLTHVEKIDAKILAKNKNAYPLFQKWVVSKLENISLLNLTKAMEWIEQELPKKLDDSISLHW